MLPIAKNGPNGMRVDRSFSNNVKYAMPKNEPSRDPNNKLIHQPNIPVKLPMVAINSTSPCPNPSLEVKYVNSFEIIVKKKYPLMQPSMLSCHVIGK